MDSLLESVGQVAQDPFLALSAFVSVVLGLFCKGLIEWQTKELPRLPNQLGVALVLMLTMAIAWVAGLLIAPGTSMWVIVSLVLNGIAVGSLYKSATTSNPVGPTQNP